MSDNEAIKEVLIEARKIISDPRNWTQKSFARNEEGVPCPLFDHHAFCFCSVGAIQRASFCLEKRWFEVEKAIDWLSQTSFMKYGQTITQANDEHSHEEILELFDLAIARLDR